MPADAEEQRRQGLPLPAALLDPQRGRLPTTGAQAVLAAHRRAVADGADGYVDPVSGLFSFTAAYHWDKGRCCDLGCRHCPWVDADDRLAVDPDPAGGDAFRPVDQ